MKFTTRKRYADTVDIKSRAFWVKVLGMLVQNYALVDATPDGAHVWFIGEGGDVFDEMRFASVEAAEAGLRYNGFWLYGEEPNDHEYLPIPAEPFVRGRLREGGGVYSSGEYWRELPQGLAGLVTVSCGKTDA